MSGEPSSYGRGRVASLLAAAQRLIVLGIFAALLAACSFIPRDSFTAQEQSIAKIPGVPGARFWVDGTNAELRDFLRGSVLAPGNAGAASFDVLAISGGAYDGAYGAGVINGWTATSAGRGSRW